MSCQHPATHSNHRKAGRHETGMHAGANLNEHERPLAEITSPEERRCVDRKLRTHESGAAKGKAHDDARNSVECYERDPPALEGIGGVRELHGMLRKDDKRNNVLRQKEIPALLRIDWSPSEMQLIALTGS